MVQRKEYLDQLINWKDEQVIKVVTGIRRCGKSTLLLQFQQWLKENGVTDEQIVSVNFEELEYEELLDYKKLYQYLKERLVSGKTTYIFLDEIQKVSSFEKVVDSLYVKPNVDLYITGSNAYMLSGDLATLLTGRYVEIKMLPLSFGEFLSMTGLEPEQGFPEYLRSGGMPYIAAMNRTDEKVSTYLEGIYNTVIVKDIDIFSYCEHHMALMYDMKVSVAYLPKDKVLGLSKIARICDMVGKRLQLQERIGSDIAEIIMEVSGSEDVAVYIEGCHSCMSARGIKKHNAKTVTTTLRGAFDTDSTLKWHFMMQAGK